MDKNKENKESKKAMAEFKQELTASKKEIEAIVKNLENVAGTWENKIGEHLHNLNSEIAQLKEENLLLKKLPEKTADYLKQLVPAISRDIIEKVLQDIDVPLKSANENVSKLNMELANVTGNLKSYEDRQLGKRLASFGATVIAASLIVLAVTYFGMKQFPQFIKIETNGKINIEQSKVTVWETTPAKHKKDKKETDKEKK